MFKINEDFESGFKAGYEVAGNNKLVYDICGYDNGYMQGYSNGYKAAQEGENIDEKATMLEEAFDKGFESAKDICFDCPSIDEAYDKGYTDAIQDLPKNIKKIKGMSWQNKQYLKLVIDALEECISTIDNPLTAADAKSIAIRFIYIFALNYGIDTLEKQKLKKLENLKIDKLGGLSDEAND